MTAVFDRRDNIVISIFYLQLAGKSTKHAALPSSRTGSPKASPRNSPRSSPRPGTPNMTTSPAGTSLVSVTPRSMNGTWMTSTPHQSSLDYSTMSATMSGNRYHRPRPPLQSFQVNVTDHIDSIVDSSVCRRFGLIFKEGFPQIVSKNTSISVPRLRMF